jgi:hypothetical protein
MGVDGKWQNIGVDLPSLLPFQAAPQELDQVVNYLQALHNYLADDRQKLIRALNVLSTFRTLVAEDDLDMPPATGSLTLLAEVATGKIYLDIENDSGAFEWKPLITSQYLTAHGVTLNDGTSGDAVADLQVQSDGNTYDLAEVSGVPGMDLEIDFENVLAIGRVVVNAYYDGSATHAVRIQLLKADAGPSGTWYTLDTIRAGLDYEQHSIVVPDDEGYITDGVAVVRLYHSETGNAAHDLYIDYVGLGD